MQTMNSFKIYLILLFVVSLSGCATSMKMTPAQLKKLTPNDGLVVGSLIITGGRDLLGRVKWDLVAENDNSSGTYFITANRNGGEVIFASKLPVGDYTFSKLRQTGFSTFTAETNLKFTVRRNKPAYIGRIVVEFPPGLISAFTRFRIKVVDAREDVMERVSNLYDINLKNVTSTIAH